MIVFTNIQKHKAKAMRRISETLRHLLKVKSQKANASDAGLELRLDDLLISVTRKELSATSVKNTFDIIMKNVNYATRKNNIGPSKYSHSDNAEHLRLIIRALVTPLQSSLIARLFLSNGDLSGTGVEIDFKDLWFNPYVPIRADGACIVDIACSENEADKPVKLNTNEILAWPWNHSRLSGTMSYIGNNRSGGAWRQDSNHGVLAVHPLGIGLIGSGGNHSIATGALLGQGSVEARENYDLTKIYQFVKCDGCNYIRTDNGAVISKVKDPIFAAVFEIGRKIAELDPNLSAEQNT